MAAAVRLTVTEGSKIYVMSSSDWVLAIDFGTSNTAAAHINPVQGNIEAISLSNDRRSMPSSVYVDSPDDISAGAIALSKAQANPIGFVPSPKRVVPQYAVSIKGYDVEPSALVAAVYTHVIERAVRPHNDTPPARLILTHPEAWSQDEVQVLIDAAVASGIPRDSITTISEPKAAAAYYTRGERLGAGEKIAVFDIGGGTVDIAVLEAVDGGGFAVLAAGGNNTIGGKSFDAAIRRWVDGELEQDNAELLAHLRHNATLRELTSVDESIRLAKEMLSETDVVPITITAGGFSHSLQLTREQFERLISAPIQRAVDATRLTFQTAGVSGPADLKALYLTGGTSRVPLVREALKELAPVASLDDPKLVVAQGALITPMSAPVSRRSEPLAVVPAVSQMSSSAPIAPAAQHTSAASETPATPATPAARESRDAASTEAQKIPLGRRILFDVLGILPPLIIGTVGGVIAQMIVNR